MKKFFLKKRDVILRKIQFFQFCFTFIANNCLFGIKDNISQISI